MRASLSRIISSKGEKFKYCLPVCLPHKPSPTGPPENGGKFKPPLFHVGLQKMAGNSNTFFITWAFRKGGNSNLFFTTRTSRKCGKFKPTFLPRWPPENGRKKNQTLFCPCVFPQIILVKFCLSSISSPISSCSTYNKVRQCNSHLL